MLRKLGCLFLVLFGSVVFVEASSMKFSIPEGYNLYLKVGDSEDKLITSELTFEEDTVFAIRAIAGESSPGYLSQDVRGVNVTEKIKIFFGNEFQPLNLRAFDFHSRLNFSYDKARDSYAYREVNLLDRKVNYLDRNFISKESEVFYLDAISYAIVRVEVIVAGEVSPPTIQMWTLLGKGFSEEKQVSLAKHTDSTSSVAVYQSKLLPYSNYYRIGSHNSRFKRFAFEETGSGDKLDVKKAEIRMVGVLSQADFDGLNSSSTEIKGTDLGDSFVEMSPVDFDLGVFDIWMSSAGFETFDPEQTSLKFGLAGPIKVRLGSFEGY